uniref:Uncharacterized protein n=1 Tax=Anguilla anguilla TaxID=7936 RepID=A0A0E9VSV3_ANGAN
MAPIIIIIIISFSVWNSKYCLYEIYKKCLSYQHWQSTFPA